MGVPKWKYDIILIYIYIKKKKNASGSISIQIIEKRNSKYKVVETIGCARNKIEKELLLNKTKIYTYIKNFKED